MKLYIKQKVFSIKDRFTVTDENGSVVYTVEGKAFSFTNKLYIYDQFSTEVAFIHRKAFSFRPRYFIEIGAQPTIQVKNDFSLIHPSYSIIGTDWNLKGNFSGHDYKIVCGKTPIMTLSKKWFTWGDTYELAIENDQDALLSLCITLIVDACLASQAAASSASA